ncbi:MAG: radical SAM protein [Bacteroidales bacterium]|jgi:hypothetical protein
MKTSDFDKNLAIRPWKPKIDMVPHLTIETNMTCNFRCKSCYNKNRSRVKTLEEIKREIDLGLSMRKADTITLLGGEPSIHPELPEIISYVKSKGVVTQMLTNGFVFLSDPDDTLLKQLKQNGLDRVLLHIDEGQEEYENPMESIHRFLKKTEKLDILTTLSWTIYKGGEGRIPDLIREFSVYPNFDGFLSTLERSFDEMVQHRVINSEGPHLKNEYDSLLQSLSLQPSVYLPSSLEGHSISWLVYLYYVNSVTQRTFYLSPALTRLYQNLYLRTKKQELFGIPPVHRFFNLTLMAAGILDCLINPGRTGSFLKLLQQSKGMSLLRYQYLAIQDGPRYHAENGSFSICYHCPDATIRNGKLSPVCLADRISPNPGDTPPAGVALDIQAIVYEHLNQ